ncbi:MAG TPA: sugar-binding protein [Candidatus Hydrogenedentes bacterium]|nr:sugar-binding protein [Candidatus Hydrogenedentota bacterium]HOS03859.1 sugar-binding protein [Candidatus Hydrogenedentota bacterium]
MILCALFLAAVALMLLLSGRAHADDSEFTVEPGPGPFPWTHLSPQNDARNFHFAILADRSGGIRDGRFEHIVDRLNLLRPEFVVHIGDIIEGAPNDMAEVNAQWDEAFELIKPIEAPLFIVPGNHDVNNLAQAKVWEERLGRLYYHFLYQNVLFLVLHTEDPPGKQISADQVAYAARVLADHPDVRWTFVLLHVPLWMYSHEHRWEEIEACLAGRKHTVLAGHMHEYIKYVRNNASHIVLAASGAWTFGRGPEYGEFDHITWIAMDDNGPRITNLLVDGIRNENVNTIEMRKALMPVRRGEIVTSTGAWCSGDLFTGGATRLRLWNPLDRPMDFQLLLHPSRQMEPSVTAIDRTLAPREDHYVEVRLHAPSPLPFREIDPLRATWRIACDFPGRERVHMHGAHRIVVDGVHVCPRRTFDGAVDAQLDKWGELPWRCLEPGQISQCPDQWAGPADCSFRFATAYDEDYVYVAVRVTDDVPMFRGRKDPWRKDAVIILLDARPESERTTLDHRWVNTEMEWELARMYGRYPGPGAFRDYLFLGVSLGATPEECTIYEEHLQPAGLRYASRLEPGGYAVEVAVPAAYLNARQNYSWNAFRLNISVFDCDGNYAGPHKALWWRPSWSSAESVPNQGLFRKG